MGLRKGNFTGRLSRTGPMTAGMRGTGEDFSHEALPPYGPTRSEQSAREPLASRVSPIGMEHGAADPSYLVSSLSRGHTDTAWPKAPSLTHCFSINYLAWTKVPDIQNHFFFQESYSKKALEGLSQETVKSCLFLCSSMRSWNNPNRLRYPLLHSSNQLPP